MALLLAIAGCSRVEVSDEGAAAPSRVRTGPPPQFSASYEAPFRPFVHCATRTLTRKQTIRLAYNDEAGLARLVAYTEVLDGRLAYVLDLWQLPDKKVLAELRVGPVSPLPNWRGEVDRVLEACQSELRDRR